MAFLGSGHAAQAEAELHAAVKAGLSDANLYIALGRARSALSRPEAAAEAFAAAVELSGEDPRALTNLAAAQRRSLQTVEALDTYRRALERAPRHLPALLGLGNASLELGEENQAEQAFRQALDIKPDYAKAFASLAKILARRPAAESAALRAQFERALENGALEPADRLLAHHGIAVLLDGLRRYDQAFEHFLAFNDLRKARIQHGSRATRISELKQRLAANNRIFASAPPRLESNPAAEPVRPLFIVGMPRSATTLVEQILCASASVRGGGERVDIQRISAELEPMDGSYSKRLRSQADRLRRDYREASLRLAAGRSVVTDKMPFNFWHVGLILSLFPSARIIHTRRDPRDTCLSCYFHNFTQPFAFACDLRELGEYYCAYSEQMAAWLEAFPTSIMTLDQRDLLAEPERKVRELVSFAGLDWSEDFLNHQRVERPVLTASNLQVREALDRRHVGRWQPYSAHLAPLLEALDPVLPDNQ